MNKTTAVRFFVILLLACSIAACLGGAPTVVGEIVVSTPHDSAPLSRLLAFATDRPAVALVTVSDGEREWSLAAAETPQTSHELPVMGLRAGTPYTLTIGLRDEAGGEHREIATIDFETDRLPADDFPPIRVNVSDAARMEPGMTLFSVIHWIPDAEDLDNGWLIVVDEEGEVVWYYRAPHSISDVQYTSRGTFLYQHHDAVVEIDGLGNILAEWYATGLWDGVPDDVMSIDVDVVHHQVQDLPSGEILTLGTEVRLYDDYPTSVTDRAAPRAPAHVVGDIAVRFRRDGTITQRWKLLDVLDPYRMSYDSLGSYWNRSGYDHIEEGTRDWSHANGVILDPTDGGVILTVRHQDAVVKLSADGELVWILGDPAGWAERFRPYLLRPEGDLEWPYHPHGPQLTPGGNLMLFDNGNFRALPPARPVPHADNHSRAVEYAIDEEALTVRQVWSYGGPGSGSFYAPFMGDANRLPITGNVLISDGGHIVDADGIPTNDVIAGRKFARLLEVTGSDNPETVFELVIDAGEGVPGWSIFKADRIPSLR